MVFWITPPLSHLIRETHLTSSYEECTQSKKHWCNVIDTITVIIKVDILYSAVLVMVDTTNDACTFASTYLLFLLCILVGMAYVFIVSAHRRILGMASVVCVLVKICVSNISLYKLDTDKLTAPFESAHKFTLVCTVSDSKTVPGCHYNLCSNHSFVLTD